MSVPTENIVWQQGEDGEISLIYKDASNAPIDLTGYELRMDVVGSSGTLYTFNTEDADLEEADEATLGADGSIHIVVPRGESLTGGAFVNNLNTALNYDIFLRNPSDKQTKILKGTVTIESSYTLWP